MVSLGCALELGRELRACDHWHTVFALRPESLVEQNDNRLIEVRSVVKSQTADTLPMFLRQPGPRRAGGTQGAAYILPS